MGMLDNPVTPEQKGRMADTAWGRVRLVCAILSESGEHGGRAAVSGQIPAR